MTIDPKLMHLMARRAYEQSTRYKLSTFDGVGCHKRIPWERLPPRDIVQWVEIAEAVVTCWIASQREE